MLLTDQTNKTQETSNGLREREREREREKSKGSSKFEREKTCLKKLDVLLLIRFDCYCVIGI